MSTDSTIGLTPAQIAVVTRYISANLPRSKIPVAKLAQLVDMSTFHFARRFKQATHETPHQFILRCRLERARDLLRNSHHTLADIAHQVGFADHSHMTRAFKRMNGVTPSEWRNKRSFE